MDESLKQKAMAGFIAFNITVIIYQIGFNSGLFGAEISFLKFLLALLLGGVVGGIAFGVMHLLQR
jgi:hypothetical protein